jgi:membrane fusion protein (multidrug efflux system)
MYSIRLLFICVLFMYASSPQAFANPKSMSPTPVFVASVEHQSFYDELEALGTLQAVQNVELNSTVTELVTEVNFTDGQRVKKGDILLKMDAAEEMAEQAEEQSRLREAQNLFNRLEPLVKRGAASESALDEAKRALQTAQARLKAIQSRIDKRFIKAPFDGIVGLRNISVGALAQPGALIATIDDDSVMKLDFTVPEIYLANLHKGLAIKAHTRAYPDERFIGMVESIDSRVDPLTRSIVVRALLDNENKNLKPGMLMHVVLEQNKRQTILIPEESLVMDGEQGFVYTVIDKDGQTMAQRKNIEIGSRRKGVIEVLSGLNVNDRVITHGTLRVRPGSAVTVKAKDNGQESLPELLMSESAEEQSQ